MLTTLTELIFQDGSYKLFKVECAQDIIKLWCTNAKEASKLFGLYWDHKLSLPTLGEGGKGIKVNVQGDEVKCTFQVCKAQDKVQTEAINLKTVRTKNMIEYFIERLPTAEKLCLFI